MNLKWINWFLYNNIALAKVDTFIVYKKTYLYLVDCLTERVAEKKLEIYQINCFFFFFYVRIAIKSYWMNDNYPLM